jgi:hypothetical protein
MPEQTPSEFFQKYKEHIEEFSDKMGEQYKELNARLEAICSGMAVDAEQRMQDLIKCLEESGVADSISNINAALDDMTLEKEKELKKPRKKTSNIDPNLQQAYYRRL